MGDGHPHLVGLYASPLQEPPPSRAIHPRDPARTAGCNGLSYNLARDVMGSGQDELRAAEADSAEVGTLGERKTSVENTNAGKRTRRWATRA